MIKLTEKGFIIMFVKNMKTGNKYEVIGESAFQYHIQYGDGVIRIDKSKLRSWVEKGLAKIC